MQILQWLFKGPHDQERENTKKKEDINDQNAKGKDIILLDHHGAYRRTKRNEEGKLGCKNMKIFALICRKDIPKACFYSTLNLKRLRSFSGKPHLAYSMKMKREEMSIGIGIANNKTNSNAHVRNNSNKVSHITEASFSNPETNDETKDKSRSVSRMKELLRWAAASKTEKGGKSNGRKVVQFRRRGTVKAIEDDDDDQAISDSPKLSFRWDLESCSTTSSSNIQQKSQSPDTDHIACTKGNWITTDSEFVVLEL